jgi:hypothetical protein
MAQENDIDDRLKRCIQSDSPYAELKKIVLEMKESGSCTAEERRAIEIAILRELALRSNPPGLP